MNKTAFIALVTTAAMVVAGGSALAQAAPKQAPVSFEALDTDGDGKVTRDEMQAYGALRMARADTNGDGALDLGELEAQAAERAKKGAQRMMERLDADEDGKITAEEMRDGRHERRHFKRADADGDGALNKAEFDTAMEKMRKRRPAH
jgi:Ca2+-binding EF-hand superfamily protein